MSLRRYSGAVCVVTGAASGIGLALSIELARRGAHVVLADRQDALCHSRLVEFEGLLGSAEAVWLDVRDRTAFEALIRRVVAERGRLDFLFNNAGITVRLPVEQCPDSAWSEILDVNLRGAVHGTAAALGPMRRQGFGQVVNVASIAGLVPFAPSVVYATSKHALVGFTASLRGQLSADGIGVSLLCPGVVRTPMLGGGRFGILPPELSPEDSARTYEQLGPMDPERFARRALDAAAANRAVIVLPFRFRLAWWVYRALPSLWLGISARLYARQRARLNPVLTEVSGDV